MLLDHRFDPEYTCCAPRLVSSWFSELLSRFFVAESLEKSTQDLEILGISRTGCPKKGRLWKLTRHRYGRGWKNMMWSVVSWLVSIAETWGHFMIHHVMALPWFEGHVTCASLPSQLLQHTQAMLYFIAEGQCEVRMIWTGWLEREWASMMTSTLAYYVISWIDSDPYSKGNGIWWYLIVCRYGELSHTFD